MITGQVSMSDSSPWIFGNCWWSPHRPTHVTRTDEWQSVLIILTAGVTSIVGGHSSLTARYVGTDSWRATKQPQGRKEFPKYNVPITLEGCCGFFSWPPQSLDLTLISFYLWRHEKTLLNATEVKSADYLCQSTRRLLFTNAYVSQW